MSQFRTEASPIVESEFCGQKKTEGSSAGLVASFPDVFHPPSGNETTRLLDVANRY